MPSKTRLTPKPGGGFNAERCEVEKVLKVGVELVVCVAAVVLRVVYGGSSGTSAFEEMDKHAARLDKLRTSKDTTEPLHMALDYELAF